MSLIQLQDEAIRKMLAPRTSKRRHQKMRNAVLRAYRQKAMKLGYTEEQASQQVKDVRDMWRLEMECTE